MSPRQKENHTGMSIIIPLQQPVRRCIECGIYNCPKERQILTKRTGNCRWFFRRDTPPSGMGDTQLGRFFEERKKQPQKK